MIYLIILTLMPKLSGPDLSDSCSNSDDGQASANIGGGCSYNDKDNGNEDSALWEEFVGNAQNNKKKKRERPS
jgi:hypothetical protein